MGKATIYSHLGNGQYSVLYQRNNANAADRIIELRATMAALDYRLYTSPSSNLVAAEAVALADYNAAGADFAAALDAWAACSMLLPPCAEIAALTENIKATGKARAEAGVVLSNIRAEIAKNRADYYAATQEISYLEQTAKTNVDGEIINTWCIDYDSLSIIPNGTVVGTIETYGAKGCVQGDGYLPKPYINLQTSANAAYSMERDHCVKPLSSINTAAMFFNWAQWLYVMANNPQHAIGTVLSKYSESQTYLDVELFGTTPTAYQPPGYPFVPGQSSITLLNVPVSYLSCGADLFTAGDKVVVRFDGVGRANPTVIGFADHPVECSGCVSPYVWPWHGLATNGVIALPGGHTHTMPTAPLTGNAWLLDNGGADLTPDAAALAAGETWLNHAHIAGRIYRGADIGADAFIFVDTDSKCWKVQLSYTFPDHYTLRLAISLSRFPGAGTVLSTRSIDIACEDLTIGALNSIDEYTYNSRQGHLEDVWTNGAKALIGVILETGGNRYHLCSLVELLTSGAGGTTGSGLTMSASEIRAHSVLTTFVYQSSGEWVASCIGVSSPSGDILQNYGFDRTWARYGYYKADGSAAAARLRLFNSENGINVSCTHSTLNMYCDEDPDGVGCCWAEGSHLNYDIEQSNVIELMEDSTVLDYLRLDQLTHVEASQYRRVWDKSVWACATVVLPANTYDFTHTAHTWTGSLALFYGSDDVFNAVDGGGGVYTAFAASNHEQADGSLSVYESGTENTTSAGYQRISGKSHGLYKRTGSSRDYVSVITPNGVVTGPSAAGGIIYRAWNRKTGDTAFSESPICYV